MGHQATSFEEAVISNHIVDLRHCWQVMWRHKWLILVVTAIGGISGFWLASGLPKQYVAETVLMIERPPVTSLASEDAYRLGTFTNEYFLTQVEVLKSDDLAFSVYKKLNFSEHFDDLAKNNKSMSKNIPILEKVESFIVALGGKLRPPDKNRGTRVKLQKFREKLVISPLTNTQAVEIRFSSSNPALAAKVTNGLAKEYIQLRFEAVMNDADSILSALRQRLEIASARLQDSKAALQAYRDQAQLLDLAGTETLQESKLRQFIEELRAAKDRYTQAKATYHQVAGLMGGANAQTYYENPLLAGIPQLQSVQEAYKAAQQNVASLSVKLAPPHPDMIVARKRLEIASNALAAKSKARVAAVRYEYLEARQAVQDARGRIDAAKASIQELNHKQSQLEKLKSAVAVDRDMREMLLSKVKLFTGTAGFVPNLARIIDKAEPPVKPSGPGAALLSFLIAGLSGLGTAAGVLWRDAADAAIKTPDDVRRLLGQQTLGHIPKTKAHPDKTGFSLMTKSGSFTAEAMRRLCVSVQMEAKRRGHRFLSVTSALPGEGKTTVALSLALAQAESSKTILIDGSFSRPHLSRLIGAREDELGLVDALNRSVPLQRAIRTLSGSDLHLLPITRPPPCFQRTMQNDLEDLIAVLKELYDYVIVDCGPVHSVSEALTWGEKTDGIVFVTRAGSTPAELAKSALGKLEGIGTPVLGVVMNDSRPEYSAEFNDYFSTFATVSYVPSKKRARHVVIGSEMTGESKPAGVARTPALLRTRTANE